MAIVTKNYRIDSHPPIFGYMLKFVSSVFSNSFSKWIGLLPNFVICLGITLLVYLISKEINGNTFIALLTAAAWAFSIGSMSTFVYIRMYALQVLFCTLLLWLHVFYRKDMVYGNRIHVFAYIYMFVCSVLAIMTHFYSLVFCFFLCAAFLLELLFNRRWIAGLVYAVTELSAVATTMILWPSMRQQLFDGHRGSQAVDNLLSGFDDFGFKLKIIIDKFDGNLFGSYGKYFVSLVLVLFVALLLTTAYRNIKYARTSCLKKAQHAERNWIPILECVILILGYTFLVVKIAPYQSGRYYKCMYPLLIVVGISTLYQLLCALINKPKLVTLALAVVFLGATVSGYETRSVNYLYRHTHRREMLTDYSHMPAVVLNGATYNSRPVQWFAEFFQHDGIFIGAHGEISGIQAAAETRDISDGFLLYTVLFDMDDDTLFDELNQYVHVSDYEKLSSDDGCNIYFVQLDSVK